MFEVEKSPRAQNDRPRMLSQMSSSSGRSSSRPCPASIRRTVFASQGVPSRQGIHFPHDSCAKNSLMLSWALRMQTSSGIMMKLADPKDEPASRYPSYESEMSMFASVPGSMGADAPPGMYAFSFLP